MLIDKRSLQVKEKKNRNKINTKKKNHSKLYDLP